MSYSSTILADSPLGYWRLGEAAGTTGSNSVIDSSGNGVNGTPTSVTFGITGALAGDANTAAQFNGSSSRIDLPSSVGVETVSVEAWVNSTASGTGLAIVEKWSNTFPPAYPFALRWEAGAISFHAYDGTHAPSIQTSATYRDGHWHHVVGTRQKGVLLKIYVDGAFAISGADTTTASTTNTVGCGIGSRAAGAQYFTGDIDEVAIYPAVLSAARIAAHYNAGITAAAAGSPRILGAGGHVIGPGAAGGVPRIVFGGNRRMGAGV